MKILILFFVVSSAYAQNMVSGGQVIKAFNAKVSCYSNETRVYGPAEVYNMEVAPTKSGGQTVYIYTSKVSQDLKSYDVMITNGVCVAERI